ncbi:hypothetical protein EON65_00790 [archaeon]|nr:MAG: hypothetical protein EON65_00790 [archaeon]
MMTLELRQLDMQRNNLSGALPSSIGRLTQLLYLNLKDNVLLSGRLPLPELSTLFKLSRLSLVHCSFENKDEAREILRSALPRCKIWM